MKKLSKVLASLLLAGTMLFGFASCDNGKTSASGGTSYGGGSSSGGGGVFAVDETMGGADVTDHIFEAEAAEFSGYSSNGGETSNYTHACTAASYAVNEGFSGGICMRNVSTRAGETEPNTFTFRFNSDKAVTVIMEVRVSSRATAAAFFNTCYTTKINGEVLETYERIPGSADTPKIINDYFYMHTVELVITLKEGENTVAFEAASGTNASVSFDYINIKTSADLTGFVPHYWDMSGAQVTETPNEWAGGTMVIADEHDSRTFEIPALTSDIYTKVSEEDKDVYYLGGTDFVIAEIEKTSDEDQEQPIDETQSTEVVSHRFEAEAAAFNGMSYSNTKQSTRSSYAVGDGFSGGICLKATSSNDADNINTFTFIIDSDKAVIANMQVRVASLDTGDSDTVFGEHLALAVNNEEVDTSDVTVLSKNGEGVEMALSNYFYMQTVTIPVTLVKGRNAIVFTAAVGANNAYNFDYIDILTTAELSFTPRYWDLTGISVPEAPTLDNTGSIRVKDSSTGALNSDYTLPTLTSDIYTTEETDGVTYYYLGNTGILITDSNALSGDPNAAVKLDLGSYTYGISGTTAFSTNAGEMDGESCKMYTFAGPTDALFRDLTKYNVLSSKTYSITYTIRNFSEESISFTICQTNSSFNITAFAEDVTLEAGETKEVTLTFNGFDNSNLITLFKLNQDVTDGQLGVYAYISIDA